MENSRGFQENFKCVSKKIKECFKRVLVDTLIDSWCVMSHYWWNIGLGFDLICYNQFDKLLDLLIKAIFFYE